MTEEFIKELHNLPDNVVAIANEEGIVKCEIEKLIQQPVEGLLYDLNRDMATNYARLNDNDVRALNDVAVAKIITWLLKDRKTLGK